MCCIDIGTEKVSENTPKPTKGCSSDTVTVIDLPNWTWELLSSAYPFSSVVILTLVVVNPVYLWYTSIACLTCSSLVSVVP